jgi:putative phosphoesterase
MPRGTRRLPQECVERLRAADLLLHAGDFVQPAVLRELERLGPPVAAVHGNVDAPVLRRTLPVERVVEGAGIRVGLVHDAGPARGRMARLRRRFPGADAVVFGHSHMPLRERADDGFQIFNPGSPTERRRAPRRTMGVARVEGGTVAFEHLTLA